MEKFILEHKTKALTFSRYVVVNKVLQLSEPQVLCLWMAAGEIHAYLQQPFHLFLGWQNTTVCWWHCAHPQGIMTDVSQRWPPTDLKVRLWSGYGPSNEGGNFWRLSGEILPDKRKLPEKDFLALSIYSLNAEMWDCATWSCCSFPGSLKGDIACTPKIQHRKTEGTGSSMTFFEPLKHSGIIHFQSWTCLSSVIWKMCTPMVWTSLFA